jgi:cell division protein FtsW
LLAAAAAAALPRMSDIAIKVTVILAFLANIAMLAAVRFTPLGPTIFGARRWIDIAGVRFQPSEFLKVTLVLLIAAMLLEGGKRAYGNFRTERGEVLTFRRDRLSLAWAYLAILASVGLVVIQPDLGTSFIVFATSLATLLLAGVPFKGLFKFVLFIILLGTLGYFLAPQKYQYALERIHTHFHPTEDISDEGYQITQSMGAISQAGMFGRGYMHSLQKMNRLPLQDRDFIYAVWVEETGMIGGLLVVALFLYFAFLCLRISMLLPYGFESVAVFGLGFNLALQALINVSTNVGALPVSGMTLPFFSSGGTSIMVSTFIVGLILGLVQRKLGRSGGRA